MISKLLHNSINSQLHKLITELKETTSIDFFSKFTKLEVTAGTYLVHSGKISPCIWYLKSGIARIFFQKENIKITQGFVFSDELFCLYSSSFIKKPSTLSIQMLTNAIVLSIKWEEWEKLKQCYSVFIKIEQLLLACWLFNLEERTIQRFFTIKEQYSFLYKRHPQMITQISSVYLADYLGTSPETISRIRAKIKNGVDIPDITPLEYLFEKRALKIGIK